MNKTIVTQAPRIPSPDQITPMATVAGRNPRGMNLKDHPELDGLNLIMTAARFVEGENNTYVVMQGWAFVGESPTDDERCVIVTGSENIVERMAVVVAANAFPVSGKLRKSGRAWFID